MRLTKTEKADLVLALRRLVTPESQAHGGKFQFRTDANNFIQSLVDANKVSVREVVRLSGGLGYRVKRNPRVTGLRVLDNPSKFTRQDFQFIADVIREMTPTPGASRTRNQIAAYFADALKRTNPNFNRSRFLKACGVNENATVAGYSENPRRAKRNPPLVTFANPQQVMSRDVVEIRYKHADDGGYYKHPFKKGQVHLLSAKNSKVAVLKRVDGKPLIGDY